MGRMRTHLYQLHLEWLGNTGSGTSSYRAYSRNHQVTAKPGTPPIPLSSDPTFRGDEGRYNPEQLLVAALSSCHMLWCLHLCADAGLSVTAYEDDPTGTMAENEDGSGEFSEVTLRPMLTLADPSRENELETIHHRAHEFCFISRSMNFPVSVEPRTKAVKTL